MTPPSRPPYRRDQLQRLLAPASIAIVGASARAQAMGARAAANLARFGGPVWLVNPHAAEIGGVPCHPSLQALPAVPDCVVVAVAREQVEATVQACADLGVGGVVVFASNYAEAGDAEGARLQGRLVDIAQRSGLRIVGPNSIGVANLLTGAAATFAASLPEVLAAEARRDPAVATPRIGIVSQSGGIGFSLSLAAQRGVAFSHVLTTGNACDVDVADCIAWLADEPGCAAIACLFEGLPEPQRLARAAELAWAAGKPLVVCKIATGAAGAAAALSHSGLLAGAHAAWQALFARHGVVVVDALEALIETAGFFARVPRAPVAPGVAVATSSGGLAVICADKAEQHGVALPQPGPRTRAALAALIPDFGAPRNPCDVTAQIQAVPTMLAAAGEAFLAEPEYGTLVVTHPTPFGTDVRMQALDAMAQRHGKMLVNLWTGEALERPEVRLGETLAHGAVMRSADRCFAAIRAWQAREALRRAGPRTLQRLAPPAAARAAAALIDAASAHTLTEREAKQVLACYGVPVAREQLAHSAAEAVQAFHALGGAVAMKVESPDLPHKTEAGVIRLGLRSQAEVAQAWDALMANAAKVVPPPRVHGVLVQAMAAQGVEVMVGARVDAQFGPLVVAGLGGIFVEVLRDTAVALAPLTLAEARALLQRLRGAALLHGPRGLPPVDLDALARVIVRVGELADDLRERIAEIDVNPLVCAGAQLTAVDALIVKAGAAP